MTHANGTPMKTPRIVGSPRAIARIEPTVQPMANHSTVATLRLLMPARCARGVGSRHRTAVLLHVSRLDQSVLLCMDHRKVVPVRSALSGGLEDSLTAGGRDVLKYSAVRRPGRDATEGQSLAEFAIVFPIFFLIFAAIIQFGLIFWSQNTLTQIARDTGRWAATQQSCDSPSQTPLV